MHTSKSGGPGLAFERRSSYNTAIVFGWSMGPLGIGCLVDTGATRMPQFALRVGSKSAKGMRPNNEDNFVVDLRQRLFVVADGMGGQDRGEVASSMAVEIIPRAVHARLAASEDAHEALLEAMKEANEAIVQSGRSQPVG